MKIGNMIVSLTPELYRVLFWRRPDNRDVSRWWVFRGNVPVNSYLCLADAEGAAFQANLDAR